MIKHDTSNQLLTSKLSEINPYLVERFVSQQERELMQRKVKPTQNQPYVTPPSQQGT